MTLAKRPVYRLYSQRIVDNAECFVPTMSIAEKNERVFCKAFYDKQFFMDYFLAHREVHRWEHIEPCELHHCIDDAYSKNIDVNLIAPRGHAKTTRVLVNMLHDLIYGEWIIKEPYDLMYISSKWLGEISVGKIRVELETNQMLRDVYGVLCPIDNDSKYIAENRARKWKQHYLELTNGSSLETVTKWWSLRWRRKHKIVLDDPEENKDVKNKKTVEEFRDFIFTTVYNMMLPWGNMFVVGTIVGEMCLVEHLRTNKERHTIIRKALQKGVPLRPQLRSLKALKHRLNKIGTARFLQEFMHIPISRKDRVVQEQWIRYRDVLPAKFDKIVMGIDVATTTNTKSDYTAVCFLGYVGEQAYEIATYAWKLTPWQNELMLVKVYQTHRPTSVRYESNIEAKLLEDLRKRNMPVQWVRQSKDKQTRLLDGAPDLEFGRVLFNPNQATTWPDDTSLEYQLTHFPDLQHDDRMDAFLIAQKWGKGKKNRSVVRA